MTETVLRLAGREFALRPLTLGQIRDVLEVVAELPGKAGGALVEAAARIVHAGLSRGDPSLTLEAVMAMEAGLDEVNAAVAAILQAAGLAPTGETVPAATAAPSLPASTALSPPGAAIPTA